MTITTPKNDLTRRQKIGRGLRIPVNQNGERVYNDRQNVVTIYASETFEQFANGLQKEYLQDGVISNKIDENTFAGLIIKKHQSDEEDTEILNPDSNKFSVPDEQPQVMHKITNEESNTFAEVLKETKITNSKGVVTVQGMRSLTKEKKQQIVNKAAEKGLEEETATSMVDYFTNQYKVPVIENRQNKEHVKVINRDNPYLNDLWEKIAKKVNYRVEFKE